MQPRMVLICGLFLTGLSGCTPAVDATQELKESLELARSICAKEPNRRGCEEFVLQAELSRLESDRERRIKAGRIIAQGLQGYAEGRQRAAQQNAYVYRSPVTTNCWRSGAYTQCRSY